MVRVGQNRIYVYTYTVFDRISGDFPAKNTVCTPYVYGSGQPYIWCKHTSISRESSTHTQSYIGLVRIINIYIVYTVFLAEKSSNIQSYTVCIYGAGQP